MSNYYLISGYWKEDNTEFENYVVKDTDGYEPGEDEDVFYFGLDIDTINKEIKLKEYNNLEFVITKVVNPYELQVNYKQL